MRALWLLTVAWVLPVGSLGPFCFPRSHSAFYRVGLGFWSYVLGSVLIAGSGVLVGRRKDPVTA
ncbi:MAG: hypothetical protein JWO22_1335 [Frankiales bacterium]|nr:hypothetical protein [Frankiales bacterium]